MRRAENSTKTFRERAAEVATLLTYEATSDLETEDADVEGWAGTVRVRRIKGRKIPGADPARRHRHAAGRAGADPRGQGQRGRDQARRGITGGKALLREPG